MSSLHHASICRPDCPTNHCVQTSPQSMSSKASQAAFSVTLLSVVTPPSMMVQLLPATPSPSLPSPP
eukprot:CAMPEP_0198679064 /NCGR_PEP_ID=MMETSP1468-20131203/2051_1 /TAXON_ID=1461545 /ORGANISM="Mantoniella sp, Strain CCMP1436" /LENGTH=66 /DNA_ID=CAMNT_0044417267 /DNA_START=78 /DNA_END=274 /DNA_ORIENTATION=+